MEDEQFDKSMAVNRQTQNMQREQGDTLRGFWKVGREGRPAITEKSRFDSSPIHRRAV